MRDTFLRKSKKDQEGVGSIFEGIECGPFHQESKETPDKDYVCNFTELSINPSMRSIFGCDKIDVEMDLIIRRFPDFPGYVEVIHGDDTIPNVSIYASYRAHRRLTERRIVKTTKNGPAYSIYDKYLDNKISKIDIVNCLAYHSWPVEANKWVSRNKPNNWPSYKLIETIKSKGFTLAPVGHFDCVDKDYQWRIGIRGEKELLLNLNETQVLCYVALRLILKDDIKLIDKDVLSSYHMKHVVFWCVEKGSCRWTNDNFKICLQTCINNLIAFIKNRTFPHYFIEDRNLINSKMTPNLRPR